MKPLLTKTIELMLGMPALSLFDLIANDMRSSFTNTPNYAPYSAIVPTQSLDEVTPKLASLWGEARQAALALRAYEQRPTESNQR